MPNCISQAHIQWNWCIQKEFLYWLMNVIGCDQMNGQQTVHNLSTASPQTSYWRGTYYKGLSEGYWLLDTPTVFKVTPWCTQLVHILYVCVCKSLSIFTHRYPLPNCCQTHDVKC